MELAHVARDRFARFRDEALQNEQRAKADLLEARKERDDVLAREQSQMDHFEHSTRLHEAALQQVGSERDEAAEREARARADLVDALEKLEENRQASQRAVEEGEQALQKLNAALEQCQRERDDALQNERTACSALAEAREETQQALLLAERGKRAVAVLEEGEEERNRVFALERDEVAARERRARDDLENLKLAHIAALEQALGAREQARDSEQSARAELQQACKERDDLAVRELRMLAELELVRRDYDAGERARQEMQDELTEAHGAVRAGDEERRKTEIRLEAAERARLAAEAEVGKVREKTAQEVAAVNARNTALSDSLEKLRRKTVQLEEALEKAQLEAARASTEGAILQSSLADLSEARHQREIELMSRDEEVRMLRREHASNAALSGAVERFRLQNAQLDEELTSSRLKAESKSTEAMLLKASLSELTQVRVRLEKELSDKGEDALKLQHLADSLTSEKGCIEVKLAAAMRYSKEQEGAVRNLTVELESLRSRCAYKLGEAEDEMTAHQHDEKVKLRALAVQIETLSAQLVGVEEDLLKAKYARDQAVSGEEQARAEVVRLSAILKAKDELLATTRCDAAANSTRSWAANHYDGGLKAQVAWLKERLSTEHTRGGRNGHHSPEKLCVEQARGRLDEASVIDGKDESKALKSVAEVEEVRKLLAEAQDELLRETSARQDAVSAQQRTVAQLRQLTQAVAWEGKDSAKERSQQALSRDGNGEKAAGAEEEEEAAGAGVEMTLELGLNFSAVGGEGSRTRRLFENSLVQDLASAADTPAARFRVLRLSPGSVIVELLVKSSMPEGHDAVRLVQSLQAHAADSDSQLMKGILTRYTRSIRLSTDMQGPAAETARNVGHDVDFPQEQEAGASLDLSTMAPGEPAGQNGYQQHSVEGFQRKLAAKDAQLYLLHLQIEGRPCAFAVYLSLAHLQFAS